MQPNPPKHPDRLVSSTSWEDADILCAALEPFAKEGRLLSKASAGDSTLALLTLDPEEVVAFDPIPANLYLLELKMAAFRLLKYEDVLQFLGVTPSDRRMEYYPLLREKLSKEAAAFWDLRPKYLLNGIIHAGELERRFAHFRRWVLPLIHAKWKRNELLRRRSIEQQQLFYRSYWDTWLWRALFPHFFSKIVPFPKRLLRSEMERVFSQIPTHRNACLIYFLLGEYREEALPRYLRPDAYEWIREKLDKVQLVQGPVQQASGKFDGFHLSTIFEEMLPGEYKAAYEGIVDRANRGARIAYWNRFKERKLPRELSYRAEPLLDLSESLKNVDSLWFYRQFSVDEVTE